MKQTEKQPKQIVFRFFSVQTENIFVCLKDTLIRTHRRVRLQYQDRIWLAPAKFYAKGRVQFHSQFSIYRVIDSSLRTELGSTPFLGQNGLQTILTIVLGQSRAIYIEYSLRIEQVSPPLFFSFTVKIFMSINCRVVTEVFRMSLAKNTYIMPNFQLLSSSLWQKVPCLVRQQLF